MQLWNDVSRAGININALACVTPACILLRSANFRMHVVPPVAWAISRDSRTTRPSLIVARSNLS